MSLPLNKYQEQTVEALLKQGIFQSKQEFVDALFSLYVLSLIEEQAKNQHHQLENGFSYPEDVNLETALAKNR